MNVYTKGGDFGETSLYGGCRINKCDPRVVAYGKVDEVNAQIGFLKAMLEDEKIRHQLTGIQKDLFILSAELASEIENIKRLKNRISESDVSKLEHMIDKWQEELPQVTDWIIPGEDVVSAYAHVVRTAIRDAERATCQVKDGCDPGTWILKYLNRLSDFMFTLSRWIEYQNQVERIKLAVFSHLGVNQSSIYSLSEVIKKNCRDQAKSIGVDVNIAIVDSGCNLVFFERMPNAFLGSIDIAVNKAKTAVRFKNTTRALGELARPDQPLYGIQLTNQQETIIFGGGYPIWINGELIGGLGISGGTVEEDESIAEAGLKKLSGVTE